jgi:hypothetical protein
VIQLLEGRTVFAKEDVWLAVDGQARFVGKGESLNHRERVVKCWPSMFTDQPPQAAGSPR